ncbi:protein obstructor-E-like [Antedon mediterranea]|uniref:protein obstructor-E-like n=1 Tax=Antedon mediterranea TaxID=105859 RepID=UPI003AF98099
MLLLKNSLLFFFVVIRVAHVRAFPQTQNTDECRSDPCENGGTCAQSRPNGGYTCTCIPAYIGDRCETDINECDSNPCQNGATCINLLNMFWCNCAPGFQGYTCDQECNQAQTGDVYCNGKDDGNYEYPGDCGKFVQCSGGVSTVTTCVPGLVYSVENDECDYPLTVGPSAQAAQVGDFCSTKSAVGLYKDPSNCEKFYQCSNGKTYHHSCPTGLVYNEVVEKCDHHSNVPGCAEPQIKFDPFCWDKDDGAYADPRNCNMYYWCDDQIAFHYACLENQAYNAYQNTCNREIGCHSLEPQYQQLDAECETANGYFPDNNYCKGYYVCILGSAQRLECDGNLVFNPQTKKCDFVSNVPECQPEDQ